MYSTSVRPYSVYLNERSETQPSDAGMRTVKQLGVFAKEDIGPGETVLQEKSLLTAIARLHDTFCDACSITLPNNSETSTIECEECNEVFFCSEDCHDLAQESYHTSLCGVNVDQKVSARDAADSLYTLLVIRAMALAETQQVHPLELKEVRYIWGDYHGSDVDNLWNPEAGAFGGLPRTLPFSFDANVLRPLHILEQMDVNIFEQSHRYDTWVFNTLYAKLRGEPSSYPIHPTQSDKPQAQLQLAKVSMDAPRLGPYIQYGVSPTTAATQT